MLSPVLAGEKAFEDIVINDAAWYEDNGIELVSGDPVTALDRIGQTATARSGKAVSYDKLLLAIGYDTFIIPVQGQDLPGVVTFRDLTDLDKMMPAEARIGAAEIESAAGWERGWQ